MQDKCSDCRFNQGGYCVIKDKDVNSDAKACCDFQER